MVILTIRDCIIEEAPCPLVPCLVPEDPFQDSLLEWRHLCMSARYIRPDEAL